jgi:hypothetical protein
MSSKDLNSTMAMASGVLLPMSRQELVSVVGAVGGIEAAAALVGRVGPVLQQVRQETVSGSLFDRKLVLISAGIGLGELLFMTDCMRNCHRKIPFFRVLLWISLRCRV